MTVFADYSRYYDLLYKDKDYEAEAEFVVQTLKKELPSLSSILELGCGTGKHAELLVCRGYHVHGIDRSDGMLALAKSRRDLLPQDLHRQLEFTCSDIRTIRLAEKFDVVISLFHVMSYMNQNADLDQVFATAKAHLNPGGIFMFDFWYGPAVLYERPTIRVKRLSDDEIDITRIAEPVIHPNENIVDVNYDVNIVTKVSKTVAKLSECHRMRYLFLPEIRDYLARHDMKLIFFIEWLTGREPGFDTWNVCAGAMVDAP